MIKYITEKDKIYFKSLKKYILIISLLFIFSLIFGIVSSWHSLKNDVPQVSNNFSYNVTDIKLSILFNNTYNKNNESVVYDKLDNVGKWFSIFKANSFSSFVQSFCGIFFGMVPVYVIVNNGVVFGNFIYLIFVKVGIMFTIFGLLPHGLIEIPAFIIASSMGLMLGYKTFNIFKIMYLSKIYYTPKSILLFLISENKNNIYQSLKFYIKFIVPMFFIAAFIEIYISTFG